MDGISFKLGCVCSPVFFPRTKNYVVHFFFFKGPFDKKSFD